MAQTLIDRIYHFRMIYDGNYSSMPPGYLGTDIWPYVTKSSLQLTEFNGPEVDVLKFDLAIPEGVTLSLTAWKIINWYHTDDNLYGGWEVPASARLFSGYLTQFWPDDSKGPVIWHCVCEGWKNRLNRTPPVDATVQGTAQTMTSNLLVHAGVDYLFNSLTFIQSSEEHRLVAKTDKLTDNLQLVATLNGFTWRVDASRCIYMGNADTMSAPYEVVGIEDGADYVTSFPPLRSPTLRIDTTRQRNRVTVWGAKTPSELQTETFTGDGSTLSFQLAQTKIMRVSSIRVNGVAQSFGVDFYDSFDDYQVLVDFTLGTFRWNTGQAPAGAIVVIYSYEIQVTVVRTIEDIGGDPPPFDIGNLQRIWLDYELRDETIDTVEYATTLADAILRDYASPITGVSFTTERMGLHAGHWVRVKYSALGIDAVYVIQSLAWTLQKDGASVKLQATCASVGAKFSASISKGRAGITAGDVHDYAPATITSDLMGNWTTSRAAGGNTGPTDAVWLPLPDGGYFPGSEIGPNIEVRRIFDLNADGTPYLDAGGDAQRRALLEARGQNGVPGVVLLSGTRAQPNTATLLLLADPPSSASDLGMRGEFRLGPTAIYFCVADNAWLSVPLVAGGGITDSFVDANGRTFTVTNGLITAVGVPMYTLGWWSDGLWPLGYEL
jgi:hypothetical protein